MAKHRKARSHTVLGGVLLGATLTMAAPAALAFATPHDVETPGDAVGRPSLGNPAPGVRVAQRIGDSVFNNGSKVNTALNDSALGNAYHSAFGYAGDLGNSGTTYDPDKTGTDAAKNCSGGKNGCNGYVKGALNAPPGVVLGNALPVKECNILVSTDGTPRGLRSCK